MPTDYEKFYNPPEKRPGESSEPPSDSAASSYESFRKEYDSHEKSRSVPLSDYSFWVMMALIALVFLGIFAYDTAVEVQDWRYKQAVIDISKKP